MSLQVHLPLNKEGNFYNQGLLGDVNVVNTPSFGSSGKIGSACMTTGSFKLSAYQTSKVLNNEQFSFASWIYITQASGSIILFGNSHMSAPNNRRFTIFLHNTLQRIHLSWQNYDSNDVVSGSGTVTGDIIPINTWTHIAVTYSSSTNKATIYINGVKSVDYTIGKFTSPTYAYETTLMENSNTVYYNDYRLYNHCLSPKEVHDLSKGLVLHYPMNDQYVQSTVYDCSGYCNNGTVIGDLQVTDDSPRYKNSIKNTSTVDNIIKAEVNMPSMDQLTLNWWGKYNDGFRNGVSVGSTVFGGYINSSNDPNHAIDYDTTAFNYRDNGWDIYNGSSHYRLNDSLNGITDNTWRMYTLVWNGSKAIQYVNGDQTNSITISGALVPWKYLYIGKSIAGGVKRVTTGCWSDIRLYSTALSDDDIKELYNTSAIINNNNTLESYEFSEANTYSINKSGVLEGAEFIEQDGEVQINNTEQVFATEFTEI